MKRPSFFHRYDATRERDPLRMPACKYRVEKRVGDVWLAVSPCPTLEAAMAFVKDKTDWEVRVVRAKDGAIVHAS